MPTDRETTIHHLCASVIQPVQLSASSRRFRTVHEAAYRQSIPDRQWDQFLPSTPSLCSTRMGQSGSTSPLSSYFTGYEDETQQELVRYCESTVSSERLIRESPGRALQSYLNHTNRLGTNAPETTALYH